MVFIGPRKKNWTRVVRHKVCFFKIGSKSYAPLCILIIQIGLANRRSLIFLHTLTIFFLLFLSLSFMSLSMLNRLLNEHIFSIFFFRICYTNSMFIGCLRMGDMTIMSWFCVPFVMFLNIFFFLFYKDLYFFLFFFFICFIFLEISYRLARTTDNSPDLYFSYYIPCCVIINIYFNIHL